LFLIVDDRFPLAGIPWGQMSTHDIQELWKTVEYGFSTLLDKIEAQNVMIAAQDDILKKMVTVCGNSKVTPVSTILPGMDDKDEQIKVCRCGYFLMADAQYCEKCGNKRPDVLSCKSKMSRGRISHASLQNFMEWKCAHKKTGMAKGFSNSNSFHAIMQMNQAPHLASKYGARKLNCDQLRDCTKSKIFLMISASVIIASAIFTAFVVDFTSRGVVDAYFNMVAVSNSSEVHLGNKYALHFELPRWFFHLDITLAIMFTFEIGMRLLGDEIMFFLGHDWLWNDVDFLFFIMAILEIVLLVIDVDMTVMGIVGFTRVGRTIRMIRFMKYSRDLRILVISVGHSLLPLLHAAMLISILISIFAVIFIVACTNYLETAQRSDPKNMEIVKVIITNFKNFPMAFLSLFMSITGGVDWWQFQHAFWNMHAGLGALYIFSILFLQVAVLNIITAFFVERVILLAKTDKELACRRQKDEKTKIISELKDVFGTLDQNGNGTLTLEEFQILARDPQIVAYFEALDIDAMKAIGLFKLFDIDGSGELEIEEFIAGCIGIKGEAKAVDIETIMYENQELDENFQYFATDTRRSFARIERVIKALCEHMATKFHLTDNAFLRLAKLEVMIEEKLKTLVLDQQPNL